MNNAENNPKRGRSHRMMEEALRLVREGKTITIIGLHNEGRERLTNIACELGATHVELSKMCITKYKGCWELEGLLRHNDNSFAYLVDHAVIEDQLSHSLEMLRRYDHLPIGENNVPH